MEQREVASFIRKLDSFVHAPANRTAADRLLPFSQQPAVVALVARVLPQYRPWTLPYYDIIGYWYSVALLSLARSEDALQALGQLTSEAMTAGWCDLDLWRRNFLFFPNVPTLVPFAAAVEHYFQQLTPQIEALVWARHIGLQVPATPDWLVSFVLSADGENKFPFQLTDQEKQQRIQLSVDVYGNARGDGESWEIKFSNFENSTGGRFVSPNDSIYRRQYQPLRLSVAPSLLHFGPTLATIEQAVGVRFERALAFSYFSKGIKNKGAVAQWLAGLPTGPPPR
jgi:hypothetical protein